MPSYVYKSELGEVVEVRRSLDDYDVPPTAEELAGTQGEEWVRQIQGGQIVTGLNMKGRW